MPKRVLFVAYTFPPVGGAGVQRTAKFVKYLPRVGWETSVLTVSNPSVPVVDNTLLQDIPPQTLVRRARTFEPAYAAKAAVSGVGGIRDAGRRDSVASGAARVLKSSVRRAAILALQPDAQILWAPGALREGRKLLDDVRHDAIIATAPPFSSFLIGAALSRASGLPLVLDYRDEWTLSAAYWENKRMDPLSRRLQERMQRSVVLRAGALVATTKMSAEALGAMRDAAGSAASVDWIYNGYDPDDFAAPLRSDVNAASTDSNTASEQSRFRLAYIGTLWNLASVEPLVRGVKELSARSPALAAKLELVFAGRRTEQQERLLDEIRPGPCRVTTHPYLDHSQAVELMRTAGGLCVLLSDLPGVQRVVPAKIFECMAAARPVIAIAPRGEVWELLAGCPAARVLAPADTAGIAAALEAEIRGYAEGPNQRPKQGLDGWRPTRHDRRSQAGQLAAILDAVSGEGRGRQTRARGTRINGESGGVSSSC